MDTDRILAVILSITIFLFGLIAVIIPAAVFEFLLLVIGIILIVYGILMAGIGLSSDDEVPKMVLFGSGLISIVIGLLAILTPYIPTIAIGYLIALWLVINGLLSIAYAVSVTWEKHRILNGLVGVISFLIGIYLFFNPGAGSAFLMLVLGIFFIIAGILSLVMSVLYWKQ